MEGGGAAGATGSGCDLTCGGGGGGVAAAGGAAGTSGSGLVNERNWFKGN